MFNPSNEILKHTATETNVVKSCVEIPTDYNNLAVFSGPLDCIAQMVVAICDVNIRITSVRHVNRDYRPFEMRRRDSHC